MLGKMNVNPLKSNKNTVDYDVVSTSQSKKRVVTPGGKHFSVGMAVMVILLLIALGAAGFFYFKYNQTQQNPSQALDEQVQSIKNAVGKIYHFEDGEDYSVATIKNIDALKKENAEFYNNAKNGDYILISPKRAILYDKDKNQVINVAPVINTPDNSSTTTSIPAQPSTNTSVPASTGTPTVAPTKKP